MVGRADFRPIRADKKNQRLLFEEGIDESLKLERIPSRVTKESGTGEVL